MAVNAAGFWIRLGAVLLDALIIALPLAILGAIISGGLENNEPVTKALSFLYSLLLPIFWRGFTIGKRICGIRISKLDGFPPGLGTMLLRNVVGGLVYGITFGIAAIVSLVMVVVREDKRSLHDLIAGTQVVHDR
ncbi:RDD family protein [Paenibacillus filicis]|uniref:RDD family protein n=1 Tax=Paenibacillus filicis TaxID=669464 RepID=A0ABU9DG37_9BACL